MRFASLASGSRGNALLVEHKQTLVMIDCGVTLKSAEQRIRALGHDPADVTALLVTHEHADHIRGVSAFARRYAVPVWMTPGTAAGGRVTSLPRLRTFACSRALELGDLHVEPFTVPHDAREPSQFVFAAGGRRLGLLSDTGHVTAHVRERLDGCDALAVEFNHDHESLQNGSYPEAVKRRIASPLGHLSNSQAAELVGKLRHQGLQWVVALHLSEANNCPDEVDRQLKSALGDGHGATRQLAAQDDVGPWLELV
jgi:phosphoribosyl 1,2-cyclic phosphodiesterase